MLATRTIMLAYYVLGEFILKLKIMYAKLDIITRIPYVWKLHLYTKACLAKQWADLKPPFLTGQICG